MAAVRGLKAFGPLLACGGLRTGARRLPDGGTVGTFSFAGSTNVDPIVVEPQRGNVYVGRGNGMSMTSTCTPRRGSRGSRSQICTRRSEVSA